MRDQLVMDQPIEQKWKPSENILRALLYSMIPRSTFDNLVWLFFLKQLLLCLSTIASQFCFGQWRLTLMIVNGNYHLGNFESQILLKRLKQSSRCCKIMNMKLDQ